MAHYLIELNGHAWFPISEKKRYDVGSQEGIACHLEGDDIALRHARIFYEKDSWWIEDLGSQRGTWKNDQKLDSRAKLPLTSGDSITFGRREFLFSNEEPLKLANEEAMLISLDSEDTTWEHLTGKKQILFILEKLTQLLDLKMDSEQFIQGFATLLHGLFHPKAIVVAFGEDIYQEGTDKQDKFASKIFREAQFKGFATAFSSMVREEKGSYRAFYAPLFLDELAEGYLYLLAETGQVWHDDDFQLFARLALFVGRGLTTFQLLRRAQEDREVLHLNLVGIAPKMQKLKVNMLRYARRKDPVFIEGAEGVGKSRIARAIHQASPRRQAPLMVLNAANFPTELFEIAICGSVPAHHEHEGKIMQRTGLLELSDGGTLLIEEAGELPLGIQPTLLAFLNTGRATPLGADEPRSYDVRLLMTSSTPLEQLKEQGRFIPEFAAILEKNILRVPSLKERKEDIPQLFRAFLGRFGEDEGLPNCVASEKALALLKDYDWKENIRELRKIVSHCFYELDPAHPIVDEALLKRVLDDFKAQRTKEEPSKLEREIMKLEHRLVQEALMAAGDDVVTAAKSLGISLVVLQKKMRNLGIG